MPRILYPLNLQVPPIQPQRNPVEDLVEAVQSFQEMQQQRQDRQDRRKLYDLKTRQAELGLQRTRANMEKEAVAFEQLQSDRQDAELAANTYRELRAANVPHTEAQRAADEVLMRRNPRLGRANMAAREQQLDQAIARGNFGEVARLHNVLRAQPGEPITREQAAERYGKPKTISVAPGTYRITEDPLGREVSREKFPDRPRQRAAQEKLLRSGLKRRVKNANVRLKYLNQVLDPTSGASKEEKRKAKVQKTRLEKDIEKWNREIDALYGLQPDASWSDQESRKLKSRWLGKNRGKDAAGLSTEETDRVFAGGRPTPPMSPESRRLIDETPQLPVEGVPSQQSGPLVLYSDGGQPVTPPVTVIDEGAPEPPPAQPAPVQPAPASPRVGDDVIGKAMFEAQLGPQHRAVVEQLTARLMEVPDRTRDGVPKYSGEEASRMAAAMVRKDVVEKRDAEIAQRDARIISDLAQRRLESRNTAPQRGGYGDSESGGR